MSAIHSAGRIPGALTPMKTSAPRRASCRPPRSRLRVGARGELGHRRAEGLVVRARGCPRLSETTTSAAPPASSRVTIAEPAAPAPETTIRTSGELLLHAAQRVGQRGQHDDRGAVLVVVEDRDVEAGPQPALDLEAARGGDVLEVDAAEARARSSRRPSTISSVSWVARQIGQASMSANRLNSAALPSITGSAAPGPMLPRPEHGRPVGDHGDGVALDGQPARRPRGSLASAMLTRPTPGVYAIDRSSRVRSGTFERDLDLAADVQQEGAVADLVHLDALDLAGPRRPRSRSGRRRRPSR